MFKRSLRLSTILFYFVGADPIDYYRLDVVIFEKKKNHVQPDSNGKQSISELIPPSGGWRSMLAGDVGGG